MHTWFDTQLDQKILDGIYYLPSLALVVSILHVEILTMSRVISPNVFTCRHKFSHEDPIEAVDGQPH